MGGVLLRPPLTQSISILGTLSGAGAVVKEGVSLLPPAAEGGKQGFVRFCPDHVHFHTDSTQEFQLCVKEVHIPLRITPKNDVMSNQALVFWGRWGGPEKRKGKGHPNHSRT